MNPQFFFEKLHGSSEYESFIKNYPDAFLCSIFFILDFEANGKGNQYHFDYYVPSQKKMFAFQLEQGIKLVPADIIESAEQKEPSKLKFSFNLSFKEIEGLILNEMAFQSIKNQLQKIIVVLQNADGKNIYFCTVFISNLGLIKAQIDDESKKIIAFEKKSFFDMMRKS
ncbi:hypothetical protein J4225_02825 [Candidatus Pacearchaeota archaeon]|nr:hypothetical protein [Candidatus Pacearchaeota archaeon]